MEASQRLGVESMDIAATRWTGRIVTSAALWLLLVACSGSKPIVEVQVEREEIQARLLKKFPVEKQSMIGRVVLSDPDVLLRPGRDDVGIALAVSVDPPLVGPREGTVAVSGTLSYDQEKKTFYLSQPKIEEFSVSALQPKLVEKAHGLVQAVADTALARLPIYTLRGRNAGEVTAEHTLQSVEVRDGRLVVKLSPF